MSLLNYDSPKERALREENERLQAVIDAMERRMAAMEAKLAALDNSVADLEVITARRVAESERAKPYSRPTVPKSWLENLGKLYP